MKGFHIYIIVMAVVMCGYSVVLLTMTKKRKKDVQEWLEQNPYEPTTQEVEVEAEKTYIYSFDKKNEQYTFTEKN